MSIRKCGVAIKQSAKVMSALILLFLGGSKALDGLKWNVGVVV